MNAVDWSGAWATTPLWASIGEAPKPEVVIHMTHSWDRKSRAFAISNNMLGWKYIHDKNTLQL